MNVRVTYAPYAGEPTEQFNPYDPLKMTIEGDLDTVANWLDEHVIAGYCALSGYGPHACKYVQGANLPALKASLRQGGRFNFTNIDLYCEHL